MKLSRIFAHLFRIYTNPSAISSGHTSSDHFPVSLHANCQRAAQLITKDKMRGKDALVNSCYPQNIFYINKKMPQAGSEQIEDREVQKGQTTSASKTPLAAQLVITLHEDGTVDSQLAGLCEENFVDVVRAVAQGLFEVFKQPPF